MPTTWDIEVGDVRLRSDIHNQYGGGRSGGMEPSAKSPNVLLFTSEAAGARYGYIFDGWHADGTFHYTGEGSSGPQMMTFGNKAVRDHVTDGRSLRLFEKQGAHSTSVRYIGAFALATEEPYHIDDAPGEDGVRRPVFVFRLIPVGPTASISARQAPAPAAVEAVPVEANDIEQYARDHADEDPIYIRREAQLVHRYLEWLARQGHQGAVRHRIPTPAGAAMYTDLFDPTRRLLVEAKANAARGDLRLALGQVLDYSRYVPHDLCAVLVPVRPADDLVELLNAHRVGVVWETTRGRFEEQLVG